MINKTAVVSKHDATLRRKRRRTRCNNTRLKIMNDVCAVVAVLLIIAVRTTTSSSSSSPSSFLRTLHVPQTESQLIPVSDSSNTIIDCDITTNPEIALQLVNHTTRTYQIVPSSSSSSLSNLSHTSNGDDNKNSTNSSKNHDFDNNIIYVRECTCTNETAQYVDNLDSMSYYCLDDYEDCFIRHTSSSSTTEIRGCYNENVQVTITRALWYPTLTMYALLICAIILSGSGRFACGGCISFCIAPYCWDECLAQYILTKHPVMAKRMIRQYLSYQRERRLQQQQQLLNPPQSRWEYLQQQFYNQNIVSRLRWQRQQQEQQEETQSNPQEQAGNASPTPTRIDDTTPEGDSDVEQQQPQPEPMAQQDDGHHRQQEQQQQDEEIHQQQQQQQDLEDELKQQQQQPVGYVLRTKVYRLQPRELIMDRPPHSMQQQRVVSSSSTKLQHSRSPLVTTTTTTTIKVRNKENNPTKDERIINNPDVDDLNTTDTTSTNRCRTLVAASSFASNENSKVNDEDNDNVDDANTVISTTSSTMSTIVCSICLLAITDGQRIGNIPCYHLFHSDCLKHWIQRRNSCPLCLHPTIAQPKFAVKE